MLKYRILTVYSYALSPGTKNKREKKLFVQLSRLFSILKLVNVLY